ncbi:MAG TPA: S41 family peptidase [Pyrinomonadaceae bacterium]
MRFDLQFSGAQRFVFAVVLLLMGASLAMRVQAQGLGRFDRDSAIEMLRAARDDLKKNYYDPELHGLDVDVRFKSAEERLKQATSRDQLIVIVAQTMLDLNDSHTFFLPPSRAARFEYGWEMQMVGDKAFVTAVKPKSDAETKGLKRGDLIVSVDGYAPSRDNIWKMYYRYYALMPATSIRLVVQSPGESQSREIEILAKITRGASVVDWGDIFVRYLRERQDVGKDREVEFGTDLLIWQMTTFAQSNDHIDAVMSKAQKFKSLIIDLRGNGGGYTDSLARLGSHVFDHDVKIADMKGRKEMKPILAKTRGANIYKGKLIVLVDSDSASASELFARAVQLEKRGTVIGDRSQGAVMASRHYDHQTGVGQVLYFGNSITVADLIMADGKSLEKTGVMPDETVLPTAADLAAQRDPVLSRAAEIAGVKIEPEKAGTLFPKDWRP